MGGCGPPSDLKSIRNIVIIDYKMSTYDNSLACIGGDLTAMSVDLANSSVLYRKATRGPIAIVINYINNYTTVNYI